MYSAKLLFIEMLFQFSFLSELRGFLAFPVFLKKWTVLFYYKHFHGKVVIEVSLRIGLNIIKGM